MRLTHWSSFALYQKGKKIVSPPHWSISCVLVIGQALRLSVGQNSRALLIGQAPCLLLGQIRACPSLVKLRASSLVTFVRPTHWSSFVPPDWSISCVLLIGQTLCLLKSRVRSSSPVVLFHSSDTAHELYIVPLSPIAHPRQKVHKSYLTVANSHPANMS